MGKKVGQKKKPFSIRELGESTIVAVRHRAIDEGRTVSAIVADALLAYLAKPLRQRPEDRIA